MNKCRKNRGVLASLFCLSLVALIPNSTKAVEETFPLLQVGTHLYTNVTVTTKAKNYVFILHSTGMENIRVCDLDDVVRVKLGYAPEMAKSQKASNWAKDTMANLRIREVKASELKDPKIWKEQSARVLQKARAVDSKLCGAIMGGTLLVYLFFSFCCMSICRKAGAEPGVLVWFPILKVFPLLRAARMSPLWFLGYLFVLPGIIGAVLWCFKIAEARGKSPLVAVGLLLPGISLLVFLYLAFSDSAEQPVGPAKEDRRTEHLMTLETA
jgi:hypothetical protein